MTTDERKQLKLMRLTREQYLKKMLLSIGKDPKKFMFEVTCNTPEQTKMYHLINSCYKNKIAFKKAKGMILQASEILIISNISPVHVSNRITPST